MALSTALAGGLLLAVGAPASADRDWGKSCHERLEADRAKIDKDAAKYGEHSRQVDRDITASGAAITRPTGITAGSTSASTSAMAKKIKKKREKRTAELGGLFSRRIQTKNPTLGRGKPSRVGHQNSA